jgi:hypothetical protein
MYWQDSLISVCQGRGGRWAPLTTKCTCFPHTREQRRCPSCKVRDAAQKLSTLVRGSMSDQDEKKKWNECSAKVGRLPKMCAIYTASISPAAASSNKTVPIVLSRYVELCVVVLNVNHRAPVPTCKVRNVKCGVDWSPRLLRANWLNTIPIIDSQPRLPVLARSILCDIHPAPATLDNRLYCRPLHPQSCIVCLAVARFTTTDAWATNSLHRAAHPIHIRACRDIASDSYVIFAVIFSTQAV